MNRTRTVCINAVVALVIAAGMLASPKPCSAQFRGGTAVRQFGGGGYGGGLGFPGGYGLPAFNPFYGGFGGGYGGGTYAYLPNYWWVSPYPTGNVNQVGYNPSAGYDWDSITKLVLDTFPEKARVTLDGIYVGTADKLGPFQLPVGDHTLRVEAPGYEPSETVLRVQSPALEQLEVRLNAIGHDAKPAPKTLNP